MSSSLYSNPDLLLLDIPGTGVVRIKDVLGTPVATRRMAHLPATAPRIAVVRHPFDRFVAVYSAFTDPADDKPPLISDLSMADAVTLLETAQIPFDRSRAYPQADMKHALMPMTHPVNRLHEAEHILRAENLSHDWSELGFNTLQSISDEPPLPRDIPPDIAARLQSLYAEDFDHLGYTQDLSHPIAAPVKPNPPAEPLVWDQWPALFEDEALKADRAQDALPDTNVPLEPFRDVKVAGRRGPTWTGRDADLITHFRKLQPEFADASRLAHLLAACIVVLRRAPDCAEALELFHRIMKNHAQDVVSQMNLRWLASVSDTLADHGVTQGQRALGIAGSLLANTLKLTETERRVYGPSRPWPPKVRWSKGGPLFDGMITFWVEKGEMIDRMRARLNDVASEDQVAGPVVSEIMQRAHRHDTVYRRFAEMAGQPSPQVMDAELQADLRALLRDAL
ncbi:MAG: hypothetical protein QNJ03_12445 [Dinoroseobacter sp.]|nr:hypothetical protein [Dinoroseobacter sp.]